MMLSGWLEPVAGVGEPLHISENQVVVNEVLLWTDRRFETMVADVATWLDPGGLATLRIGAVHGDTASRISIDRCVELPRGRSDVSWRRI